MYVTNNKYDLGFGCDETNNTKEITLQELVDSGDLSLNSSGKIINPITDQEILLTTKVEVVYDCVKQEFIYKVNDINCASKDNNEDDELIAQAIYSDDDSSLTFVKTKKINVGDSYNGKTVTEVFTGFETEKYNSPSLVPWHEYRKTIERVIVQDVISPISTSFWFEYFDKCTYFYLKKINTLNVTDMSWMFSNCNSLTSLDLNGWDTSNVTNMSGMFVDCSSLISLDVSNWDTSNVTNMIDMFNGCSSLTSLDVSRWDTSNVTNINGMFSSCSSLTSLDASGWDTSNVTDMRMMFNSCSSLTSLDVNGWDTSNVTDMFGMFAGCSSLISLDLNGWDTSNVTDMIGMFNGCSSLTSLDVSGWDTSNVRDMNSMFEGANKLYADCSNWDVSKVVSRVNFKCNAPGVVEPNWGVVEPNWFC